MIFPERPPLGCVPTATNPLAAGFGGSTLSSGFAEDAATRHSAAATNGAANFRFKVSFTLRFFAEKSEGTNLKLPPINSRPPCPPTADPPPPRALPLRQFQLP